MSKTKKETTDMNAQTETEMETTVGLDTVSEVTLKFSAARRALAGIVLRIEQEQAQVMERHKHALAKALYAASEARLELCELVTGHPELFERPKTQVFGDIRVGYRKGAGKITWEDEDEVVRLIEDHFMPEEAELLIITTKKPNRKMLGEMLSVDDFARIGCEVEGTGDVPFIKPLEGDVEKLVKQLALRPKGDKGAK